MNSDALVVAHMGFSEEYPRNTLPAIQKSVEAGADVVEIDVQYTKDGHLILIHEPDFSEYYAGSGRPREMTLAEVKAIDAGVAFDPRFAGETVPTLAEAMDLIRATPLSACVELKVEPTDDPEYVVHLVTTFFDARDDWGRFVVNCDDWDLLAMLKAEDRRYRIVPDADIRSYGGDIGALVDDVVGIGADGVEHRHRDLNRELVGELHRICVPVWAWTANEERDIDRVYDLGCDAVLTNRPDLASAIRARSGVTKL